MSERAGGSLRFAAALAPAFAVGALLRLWRLPEQLLGGDELHPLRVIFELPLPKLLVTYHLSDVCLPLVAFDRALSDAGILLSEWHLRGPAVLAGLALLGALPWSLRGPLGARGALVLGWLTALSPLLFFYARIARSYALLALFAFAAIRCFERWWHEGRLRHALAYGVLAALAIYVHPAAGPFVAAPLLYALATLLRDPEARRARLLRLAAVGAGLLFAAGLFLVPARESLERLVTLTFAARGAVESPYPPPPLPLVLAGTRSPVLALIFFGLAARGLLHLWRRRVPFAAISTVCVGGGLGGLALLAWPVLPRYAIASVPFLLAWVAVGLSAPLPRRLRLPRGVAALAGVAFVLALVASGPFTAPGFWRSSFMHHSDYVNFTRSASRATLAELPPIYRQLSEEGDVIEVPWLGSWEVSRAIRIYQQAHGRGVRVASTLPWLNDPRLALRNVVRPGPEALLADGARYLVLHLDMDAEEAAVAPASRVTPEAVLDRVERRRQRGAALAGRLRRAWGAPDHATPGHLAWDLERVRRETSRGP